jgi:hypothetical protein
VKLDDDDGRLYVAGMLGLPETDGVATVALPLLGVKEEPPGVKVPSTRLEDDEGDPVLRSETGNSLEVELG